VAEALVRSTFCTLGLPRQILSDLGTEFQNRILTEALTLLRVTQLRTTSFRPSCNGRGERVFLKSAGFRHNRNRNPVQP
jgi:hypothetical protein